MADNARSLLEPYEETEARSLLAPIPGQDYGPAPESTERTLGGTIKDLGISALAKMPIMTGQAAVGLGSLATGGRFGKFMEEQVGYRPEEALKALDEYYSPAQKAANKAVEDAEGFWPKLAAGVQNPSVPLLSTVESLGFMGLGGSAGRLMPGAAKAIQTLRNPVATEAAKKTAQTVLGRSAAAGEGLVSAGLQAENIRQQTDDGLLNAPQTAAALGTGLGVGLISRGSNLLANKFKILDPDVLMTGGYAPTIGAARAMSANSLAKQIGGKAEQFAKGFFTEGVMEEMPQEGFEQLMQNMATGKPLFENVPENMAMGVLSGGIMGGPVAMLNRPQAPAQDNAETTNQTSDPVQPAPPKVDSDGPLGRAFNAGSAVQQWAKPEFIDRPNAEAIVRNRTVPGMDTQAFIDQQFAGAGSFQPTQWAQPEFEIKDSTATTTEVVNNGLQEKTPTETQEVGSLLDAIYPAGNQTTDGNNRTTGATDSGAGRAEPGVNPGIDGDGRRGDIGGLDRVGQRPLSDQEGRDTADNRQSGDALDENAESLLNRVLPVADEPNLVAGQTDTATNDGTQPTVQPVQNNLTSEVFTTAKSAKEALQNQGLGETHKVTRLKEKQFVIEPINVLPGNQATTDFTPTHTLADGTPVRFNSDENAYEDVEQSLYEPSGYETPITDNAQSQIADAGQTAANNQAIETPAASEQIQGQSTVQQQRPMAGQTDAVLPGDAEIVDGADSGQVLTQDSALASSDILAPIHQQQQKETTKTPKILTQKKETWVRNEIKRQGLNPDSPSYDKAVNRIREQYEKELDRALAELSFEAFKTHPLNKDATDAMNRTAWETLRSDLGIPLDDVPVTQATSNKPDVLSSTDDNKTVPSQPRQTQSQSDSLKSELSNWVDRFYGTDAYDDTPEVIKKWADSFVDLLAKYDGEKGTREKYRALANKVLSERDGAGDYIYMPMYSNQSASLGLAKTPEIKALLDKLDAQANESNPEQTQATQQDKPASAAEKASDTPSADDNKTAPATGYTPIATFKPQKNNNIRIEGDTERIASEIRALDSKAKFKPGKDHIILNKDSAELANSLPVAEKVYPSGAKIVQLANGRYSLETNKVLSTHDSEQAALDSYREAYGQADFDATFGATQAIVERPKQYEIGKSLTKEQRQQVLSTLTDVYKQKDAEKEVRINRNGDEYTAYPYQPELFEQSDITGKMIRFYVTLPDGRIAHPTELFPDMTESKVNSLILEQESAARRRKEWITSLARESQNWQFDSIGALDEFWDRQAELGKAKGPLDRIVFSNGKQYISVSEDNLSANPELYAELEKNGWTKHVFDFQKAQANDQSQNTTPQQVQAKQNEFDVRIEESRKEQDKSEKSVKEIKDIDREAASLYQIFTSDENDYESKQPFKKFGKNVLNFIYKGGDKPKGLISTHPFKRIEQSYTASLRKKAQDIANKINRPVAIIRFNDEGGVPKGLVVVELPSIKDGVYSAKNYAEGAAEEIHDRNGTSEVFMPKETKNSKKPTKTQNDQSQNTTPQEAKTQQAQEIELDQKLVEEFKTLESKSAEAKNFGNRPNAQLLADINNNWLSVLEDHGFNLAENQTGKLSQTIEWNC